MIPRLVMALVVLSMTGCGVVYTSIRQEPDGSYVMTATHDGFIRINGQVYRCTAEGQNMRCQLTAEN